MYQSQYLLLTTPMTVNPSGDPEGPTINATALKILKSSGMDELSPTPHIEILYAYGFVNSRSQFRMLENIVRIEIVVDIPERLIDNASTGMGLNPVTNQSEKSGTWLTNLLQIPPDQKNRNQGDFRVQDLYTHIMSKLSIDGTITVSQLVTIVDTAVQPAIIDTQEAKSVK